MKTVAKIVVMLPVATLLPACATPQAPVTVVADTYCQAARKITWSVDDTAETIRQVVRHNGGIDKACKPPAKTS